MKIIVVGGGSGGHVTPVLAVLRVLSKQTDQLETVFVTDRKFGAKVQEMIAHSGIAANVTPIYAGKFRRYHRVSWWRQLFDILTLLRNARDLFATSAGFFQSLWLVVRFRPDVVFTKGGFVCVPLGLAARAMGVPIVAHDSDAHPGLANRILSRWAVSIATGSPAENYPYPHAKIHYVGIPVDESFAPVSAVQQRSLIADLGFHDTSKPTILVTGGGLGARAINHAIVSIAPFLIDRANIYHVTGSGTYDEVAAHALEHIDYNIVPFVSTGMAAVMGAADIVVTRAGATALQELAAMHKAVIIVPNPYLTAGHQLKNAEVYQQAKAAVVVDELELDKNPLILRRALESLLDNPAERERLGRALGSFAKPDAALDTAHLIVKAAKRR